MILSNPELRIYSTINDLTVVNSSPLRTFQTVIIQQLTINPPCQRETYTCFSRTDKEDLRKCSFIQAFRVFRKVRPKKKSPGRASLRCRLRCGLSCTKDQDLHHFRELCILSLVTKSRIFSIIRLEILIECHI